MLVKHGICSYSHEICVYANQKVASLLNSDECNCYSSIVNLASAENISLNLWTVFNFGSFANSLFPLDLKSNFLNR